MTSRTGLVWTPEELAVVADRTLKAPDVAERLGRTIASVHNKRRWLDAGGTPEARRALRGTPRGRPSSTHEYRAGYGAEYRARPEVRKQRLGKPAQQQNVAAWKRRNAASADVATNHGKQWTSVELEIASRDSTAATVAAMLGRSIASVINVRRRMRNGDVKLRRLAGIDPPETTSTARRGH